MSEFRFINNTTVLPLTGVTVSNPAGSNPANELPANLKDLSFETKWLDFNKTTAVIFDFGTDTTIDSYNWATANDANERDPVDWIFSGSADGVNWIPLDLRKNYTTDPGRKVYQAAPFALPENVDPVISSFTSTFSVVTNGTSFDLNWQTGAADMVTISGVGTVAASGSQTITLPDNSIATYTLTATNTTTNATATATLSVKTVAGGEATYQYVRFTPLKLRDQNSPAVQLAEFSFVNDGAQLPAPVSATNPGGTNAADAGEGALKAIDNNNTTKWYDGNRQPLVMDFGAPTTFDAYYYVTGNDSPDRDPVRWILEGSNDQLSWTLIDDMTQVDFAPPTARNLFTPDIPLPGATLHSPIVSFSTDAPTLVSGQPAVLSWQTLAADTVTIDNGIGVVNASGMVTVSPTATTTYTITTTKGTDPVNTSTAQLTVNVVNSTTTSIAYSNFDNAGSELITLRDSSVLNDFANRTQPGNFKRLRITSDTGGKVGAAWFANRVDLSQGFDTTFDLSMITLVAGNSGADGMSFTIQNLGNSLIPPAPEDKGFKTNSVTVNFDSYINSPEVTAASVQVIVNGVVKQLVELPTAFPAALGAGVNDFSQNTAGAVPHHARVTYGSGKLNIYINNVQILTDYAISLSEAGAVDANGKAYVGFTARTGGLYEAHDVTSWTLTPGPPAGVTNPLALTSSAINTTAGTVALTWSSNTGKTYRVTTSADLLDWTGVLQSGIASGGATTSATVNFTPSTKGFFRVEEE